MKPWDWVYGAFLVAFVVVVASLCREKVPALYREDEEGD